MSLLNDVQGYFEIILVKTDNIEQLRDIMFDDSRLSIFIYIFFILYYIRYVD